MNLRNSVIQGALTKEERQNLVDALRRDEVIIPAVLKILAVRLRSTKPCTTMIQRASYPWERAAKDGAALELNWLVELFETDKGEIKHG